MFHKEYHSLREWFRIGGETIGMRGCFATPGQALERKNPGTRIWMPGPDLLARHTGRNRAPLGGNAPLNLISYQNRWSAEFVGGPARPHPAFRKRGVCIVHVCGFHIIPYRYFTSSISDGRHCLVKNVSSGLYRRRIVNQPLPGTV